MSASTNDKVTDVRNAARPNSARVTVGRNSGGTTLTCDNLTGWPTASKVHFVTYTVDSSSNPVAGTQLDCYGIVSGNAIGSFHVVDGTDTGNVIGDYVEMLPTAAWGQDLADALTNQHTRVGAHQGVTTDTISTSGNATVGGTLGVTGAATLSGGTTLPAGDIATADVADDAITAAKMINGQIYRHQGDGSTTLGNAGTTTKDLNATDVKIQTGKITGAGNNSDTIVTFPVAFTNTPLIMATPFNSGGAYPTWYVVSETNSGFTFRTGVNVASFSWMAIGI